jgi:c(7)-type cytochrome triheme protein
VAFYFAGADAKTFGVKKKRPKPSEYGNVVLNNGSEKNGIAPVVFRHWLHRSRYSCRLCHIDIGFAMTAGETGITEDDNRNGMYCGACHDGNTAFAWEETLADGTKVKHCDTCHSKGKKITLKNNFRDLRRKLPRERFGNGIDWMASEDRKLIKLADYLEGVSIKRPKLKDPEELELTAKEAGMPNIIFSHKKHAIWSGCELCHPDIFGVKKGATVYSMQDIFNGLYCGACHGRVAFPNNDCQRCHTEPVF